MFERFTADARRSIVMAQELARQRGAPAIEIDDVFRAVLAMPATVGTQILVSLGMDPRAMFTAIGAEQPTTGAKPVGHIPFTEPTKQTLVKALHEATALGDDFIGTEHLLLGVMVAGESRGWRHLRDAGFTADAYRDAARARTDRAGAGASYSESLRLPQALACLAALDAAGAMAHSEAALSAARADGDTEQLALAQNLVAWIVALTLDEARFAEALALVDQALVVAPGNEAVLGTRWAVLTVLGRGAETIAGHEHVLSLDAEVVGDDLGTSHSFLARALLDAGAVEQARHHLREADRLGSPWPIHRDTWRRIDEIDGTWLPPS